MARRSNTQITAEYAKKIIKKLKGKKTKAPGVAQSHDFYDVYSDKNVYLTSLSLRHGAYSTKYLGTDHMISPTLVNAFQEKHMAH